MARLTVQVNGKTWTLRIRDEITAIGRDAVCQVRFEDEKLSRKHCRIERGKRGGYVLEDLSSKNGTYVNGIAVFPRKQLKDGDEIRIGGARILFEHRSLLDRVLWWWNHGLVWKVFWILAVGGTVYGLYRGVRWFFEALKR